MSAPIQCLQLSICAVHRARIMMMPPPPPPPCCCCCFCCCCCCAPAAAAAAACWWWWWWWWCLRCSHQASEVKTADIEKDKDGKVDLLNKQLHGRPVKSGFLRKYATVKGELTSCSVKPSHSLTHSLTHSPTHSLTHSPTDSPAGLTNTTHHHHQQQQQHHHHHHHHQQQCSL
jgi:hypothetical protein